MEMKSETSNLQEITSDDINKILFVLQGQGGLQLDICDFLLPSESLKSLTYLRNKESASDTDVFFLNVVLPSARLYSPQTDVFTVALKVWLNWNEKSDEEVAEAGFQVQPKYVYESLVYEKNLYKYITENIIQTNTSINFIPYVGFSSCLLKNILENVSSSTLEDMDKTTLLNHFQGLSDMKLNILVTGSLEKRRLKPFPMFLKQYQDKIQPDELIGVLYQILYAFYTLEKFKIMHNDVHFGNILIEVLNEPIVINLNDKFTFESFLIPKIYDWDHGFAEALGPNPLWLGYDFFLPGQDLSDFVEKSKNFPVVYELLEKIIPIKTNVSEQQLGLVIDKMNADPLLTFLNTEAKSFEKNYRRVPKELVLQATETDYESQLSTEQLDLLSQQDAVLLTNIKSKKGKFFVLIQLSNPYARDLKALFE